MRTQFRDTLMDLAAKDERIVLLLGDISVYLFKEFQERYPTRFYNMGICENTIVSAAAGLAATGLIPFVHTIAPFITERCYEQIKLDVCYNKFPINIVSCGASFDYAWDGASHHCLTDLEILRMLPDMEVMQPGSKKEVDVLLRSQYASGKPSYFRLSDCPHKIKLRDEHISKFGKGMVFIHKLSDITIVTAGPLLQNVVEACGDLKVNILYFHTIKPIDETLINWFASESKRMIVVHDAHGLFEAIAALTPWTQLDYHGIPDTFVPCYGTVEDVHKQFGLDVEGIRKRVKEFV